MLVVGLDRGRDAGGAGLTKPRRQRRMLMMESAEQMPHFTQTGSRQYAVFSRVRAARGGVG